MKLDNIELDNFRQYFGTQRAQFARDRECNVTVFNGANGTGKTSLFVAINWCLYGEGAEGIGYLVSKEALKRANPGETVTARVKIAFVDDGERYICSRAITATRSDDGSVTEDDKPTFQLTKIKADGQAITIKYPMNFINSILPSNIRSFFLFDGEKIDRLSKPESVQEVRDSIFLILKLEVMDRAKKHLSEVASRYRAKLRQSSPDELKELLLEDEKIRQTRETALEKTARLEKETASAKTKIKDIESRLHQLESARDLQSRRDALLSELERQEAGQHQTVKHICAIVAQSPPALAYRALSAASDVLQEKRVRGEIPSGIRQQFVRDLLDRGKCVCGRDILEGDQPHHTLSSLLATTPSSSLEDAVINTHIALNRLVQQNRGLAQQLGTAMRDKTTRADAIRVMHEELDEVQHLLQSTPQEEVQKLENQRQQFQADLESYMVQTGECREALARCERELSSLKTRIDAARRHQASDEAVMARLSLAQDASDAIAKMYHDYADDMRQSVERETKQVFRRIVWKTSHFQDIRLTPDYQLEVIDRYGLAARPELSAGERQVLSLSFITGMVKVAQEETPIVMDTPFGRLSSEHRALITENLPKLAPQLVLFVTDEELHDEARLNLSKCIGKEYRLDFDQETSCTAIEEI